MHKHLTPGRQSSTILDLAPRLSVEPKGSRCAVVFGKPMQIDPDEDVRDYAKRIQAAVNQLADEFASGWWEARKKAHRGDTPDLNGPEGGAWRRRWALGPAPGSKRRNNKRRWPDL